MLLSTSTRFNHLTRNIRLPSSSATITIISTTSSYRSLSTSNPINANTMLTPPPTPKQPRSNLPGSNSIKPGRTLTLDTIHKSILDVEYAVRGELAIKADKYTQMLKAKQGGGKDQGGMESRGNEQGEEGVKGKDEGEKLPFDKVVTANIGNPQQRGLDQKPITFWRQVSWRGV
jgi:hypothetical protein